MGITLDEYWGDKMTPKLFEKFDKAYRLKIKTSMMMTDATNHLLGQYIKIAIGDVLAGKNKYPDEPLMSRKPTSTLKRKFTQLETEAYLAKIRKENADEQKS